MKRLRNRRIGLLLAVLMLASLLSGCGLMSSTFSGSGNGKLPRRMNYQGTAPIDMVPFSQMEYTRPDGDAMLQRMDDLIEALETRTDEDDDVDATLDELDAIYGEQYTFWTMQTLAEIHSDIDQTVKSWLEEVRYCDKLSIELSQKYQELMYACAASDQRDAIGDYLGEGSLDGYEGDYTYPEALVNLQRRESELESEYYEAYADMSVTYDGQEYDVNSLVNAAYNEKIDLTPEEAVDYYYAAANDALAPIFVELVKVRHEIAAEYGYDSYIEFAYDSNGRDYTPDDVSEYAEAIVNELVPLYKRAVAEGIYAAANDTASLKPRRSLALVEAAANAMGGYQEEAMTYMLAYDLYDVDASTKKYNGSYEMYLEDYESPFVLVNSTGYLEDVLTIAHEFGHFTDDFVNYGIGKSTDINEVISQGMEYLTLFYLEDEDIAAALTDFKLMDALRLYIEQGSYNAFEERVYALDDAEITVENINAISLEVSREFGLIGSWNDAYYAESWVDISHFFEQPFYVISYCVSDSAAFQLYEMEAESDGLGVDTLNDYIDIATEEDFFDLASDCGFTDPISAETIEGIAETIRDHFGL